MTTALTIKNLNKTYPKGLQALKGVNLEIRKGEIFALLGPNGAGKTTLIGCVCGIVNPTSGQILVNGFDVQKDFYQTRKMTGMVPQELAVELFEPVQETVNFSRGLFGMAPDADRIESLLKRLMLWDKRKDSIMTLSGGMKRRVMIAKALSHEPQLLFLDEPTAGVDVELRRDMWNQIRELKNLGVTIILTTHYIEEAEGIADRIGVINKGEIIVTENTRELMHRMGRKEFTFELSAPLAAVPGSLSKWNLQLKKEGTQLRYLYDVSQGKPGISTLLAELAAAGVAYDDMHIYQSKLEDIFIQLVKGS